MALLKVYEVAEKVTRTGKPLKKCVIQEEGKQYPHKNVTVWQDHPDYDKIKPGFETTRSWVEVKDSDVKNPHGGYYKNRTLRVAENPNGTLKVEQGESVDLKKLKEKVDIMWKAFEPKLNVPSDGREFEYDAQEEFNALTSDELTDEDIPF